MLLQFGFSRLTGGGSEGESLYHVAHSLDAAVSDDRHAEAPSVLGDLVHRGPLGPPARHDYKSTGE